MIGYSRIHIITDTSLKATPLSQLHGYRVYKKVNHFKFKLATKYCANLTPRNNSAQKHMVFYSLDKITQRNMFKIKFKSFSDFQDQENESVNFSCVDDLLFLRTINSSCQINTIFCGNLN